MSKPKYLTKSRFKMALECPTKLYYTAKKEYANRKLDDPFLLALADGGFQVGELAKKYYPNGIDIKELDYETALKKTDEALAQGDVVIFEAAIKVEDLFIRVDVLKKTGDNIEIFEVKSKSYDSEGKPLGGSEVAITAGWRPYLEDVAFQKFVVGKAFPSANVTAFLTLVDKVKPCPSDGLHQKFRVVEDLDGRKGVKVSKLTAEDLSSKILIDVPVDSFCEIIYSEVKGEPDSSYAAKVQRFSDAYKNGKKITAVVNLACKECEFFAEKTDLTKGDKCGKSECWAEAQDFSFEDVRKPTILDIWDNRSKDKMIKDGILRLNELSSEDLKLKRGGGVGLSRTERQWMQVEKAVKGDDTHYIGAEGVLAEMKGWKFPLHFIDFETAMPAIPFNKGRLPYEGIAFQFSHHILHEDGRIEHKGEFIDVERGKFPNYRFLKALKKELEGDEGTIFRYATHENTYLNHIYSQLKAEKDEVENKDELLDFIKLITTAKKDNVEQWSGKRKMVDMLKLVKQFYYDPRMGGSNSIKYVLPAILSRSDLLRQKYSKPIYGATGGIPSLNFKDHTWLEVKNGKVSNPYDMLPKVFENISDKDFEFINSEDKLKDGGAAMTAYARMQYVEMGNDEREAIRQALLKYCELDTLAMVMLYEGLKDLAEMEMK